MELPICGVTPFVMSRDKCRALVERQYEAGPLPPALAAAASDKKLQEQSNATKIIAKTLDFFPTNSLKHLPNLAGDSLSPQADPQQAPIIRTRPQRPLRPLNQAAHAHGGQLGRRIAQELAAGV
jgi:hypothetical protein